MFHLFNNDLGGVRGTFGFFLSMATRTKGTSTVVRYRYEHVQLEA